jgi:hypothetical protein
MNAAPSLLALALHELQRRIVRGTKRIVRPLWMWRLRRHNLHSAEAVVGPGGPVVSLTTFEPRFEAVFYTIESIGRGQLKPSRLVLWVAHPLAAQELPATLARLVKRGLEVRAADDTGPHKKYFPLVMSEESPTRALVTADDDVLYPRDWLAGLVQSAAEFPDAIHCYRGHVMAFAADGRPAPYKSWPACRSNVPSHLNFSTGVSGVLFPVKMQLALRKAADGFLACCPRADDIWLKATAWRTGVPVRQVRPFGRTFFEIPGTRKHGLAKSNVEGGSNDQQILRTFTPEELEALRAER